MMEIVTHMDEQVRALKIEIAEAITRKLRDDPQRNGYVIAVRSLSMALCDLISVCAQSEEHRRSMVMIASHMLEHCTSVKGASAVADLPKELHPGDRTGASTGTP